MAQTDSVTTNPHVVTAAAAGHIWKDTVKHVQLIQWVDDNADIADNSNLIITINGVAIEATVQADGTVGTVAGAVIWEMSFPNGFPVKDLLIATMSAGQVYIFFK
ncbi:hypothetical protein ACFL3R_00645 [Thermodesulfobacteriota bacterium]